MSHPDKPATPDARARAAIDVQDLHKYFGDNEVLKGIDFHVDNGQVVCVIGPSGSGKSTLLRCVNLLEEPTRGKIFVEGDRDHRPRRRRRQGAQRGSAWSSSSSTCSRT